MNTYFGYGYYLWNRTRYICFYYIKADVMPEVVSRMFEPAADVPAPFRPFKTQYDTYLMKYREVVEYSRLKIEDWNNVTL